MTQIPRNSRDRPQLVFPQILLIIFELSEVKPGSQTVRNLLGWNDPDTLVRSFIADLEYASYGFCKYQIAARLVVDGFPVKEDGFQYNGFDYVKNWRERSGFHQPDWADYNRIAADFSLFNRIERREIDEVWLFAGPYAGFFESRMVGSNAFWCNSPPLRGYGSVNKRAMIMGFNYERGVGEMLESYGHRAESIINHLYRDRTGDANLWERFTRYDLSHRNQSEVGNIHFAPNSRRDYDWGNQDWVHSKCDNWLRFPDLSGEPRLVNCQEWGNGDIREHHLWWLRHLPHAVGQSDGIANNWWQYIVNPNLVH